MTYLPALRRARPSPRPRRDTEHVPVVEQVRDERELDAHGHCPELRAALEQHPRGLDAAHARAELVRRMYVTQSATSPPSFLSARSYTANCRRTSAYSPTLGGPRFAAPHQSLVVVGEKERDFARRRAARLRRSASSRASYATYARKSAVRGARRTSALSSAVRFFTISCISCCARPCRQMRVWRPERANARA
jgi:hypothetical protein